jgi:hypothetical protein
MNSQIGSPCPDIVYLWVNGQDSEWLQRRQIAEKQYYGPQSCRFSNVEGRFRDNDELRFSLRSLMPHLHAFGQIFIITDRQRPAWLLEHPRISIIDHNRLRDAGMGPTYSSKALEACLDRLPSANNFVYLNDDVFLGSDFSLGHFFDLAQQKTVIHFEQWEDRDPVHDVSQNLAMSISHQILAEAFNPKLFLHKPMAHAPRYLIHEQLKSLFQAYPNAVREAREEIFRESSIPSVVADLYGRWMLACGKGIEKPVPHSLLSSGSPLIKQQLSELVKNFDQLSYFCINDTLDNTPDTHANFLLIQAVLSEIFPEASEFEDNSFNHCVRATHHQRLQAC